MKKLKYMAALVALLTLSTFMLNAQSYPSTNRVTLAWDASESNPATVTNYAVYYGDAPRHYTNRVNVGTNLTCVLTNLPAITTFYFAATCQGFGLESDFSNEVNYTTPRPKPVAPGNLRKQ